MGLTPSGNLRLTIYAPPLSNYGKKTAWEDGPKKGKVEQQIGKILDSLEPFADGIKKERLEREEWNRRWKIKEEERRKRKAAQLVERQRFEAERRKVEARRTQLHEDARIWNECHRLRAYVDAVEQSARERGLSVESNEKLGRWLAWAREYIESIEPLHRLGRYHVE